MNPEDFRPILKAAYSVATGREHEWKGYARDIVARHKDQPLDDVVAYLCTASAYMARLAKVPPEQVAGETVAFYSGLCAWGRSGFPHFSLSPDFFHAVAQTDFGDGTDEPLYLPFHAFTVSFPATPEFGGATKAFVYKLPKVLLVPLDGGAAHDFNVKWALYRATLMTPDPIFTQWNVGLTRKELLDEENKLNTSTPGYGARPVDAHEVPMLSKLRMLLANVMSYVEAAGPLPTVPRKKGAAPLPVELTHSQQANYDVGRCVKLDAGIRAALLGTGGTGKSWRAAQRFIVRGHWRNQAHGEGRALRKRLWIEPHWKGPDNVLQAIERTYEVTL